MTVSRARMLLIMLSVLIVGAALGYYASIFTTKSTGVYTSRSALNRECSADALNKTLNAQVQQARELKEAIVNIRKLSLSKPGSCTNSVTNEKSRNKSYGLIVSDGYAMPELISRIVEANANTYQNFDEKVAAKIESLISLLQKNIDYCSNDFPSTEKLKSIQYDINADMDKFIKITKQKLGFKE